MSGQHRQRFKVGDILHVEWGDASSNDRWMPREDLQDEIVIRPLLCHTIGFLVYNARKALCVAASKNENDHFGGSWVIPKSCITRISVVGKR